MRLPMLAVNHLVNAALAAECTRKKIVSRTDAFHRNLQLETCRRERSVAGGGSCTELDDSPVISVAVVGSSSAQTNRSMIGCNGRTFLRDY